MPQNKFANIISATRKRRGISQKAAAIDLNISQALLSHYENGIRECSLDFLVKLSDYYGVTCDYLLGHSTAKSARSQSAGRQREYTRSIELLMLLVEHSQDEKLKDYLDKYLKTTIYRGLKLFDGVCSGLKFSQNDTAIGIAEGVGEINFAKAYEESSNLKDTKISLVASSLEYPNRLIDEVESRIEGLD